jgi:hypothetical protein
MKVEKKLFDNRGTSKRGGENGIMGVEYDTAMKMS